MNSPSSGCDIDLAAAVHSLTGELRACQALSRAVIRALAARSASGGLAVTSALEDEAESALRSKAHPRVISTLEEALSVVASDVDEERYAQLIEQALASAADQACSSLHAEARPHAAQAR